VFRDPQLFEQFLAELRSLKAFRERYLSMHPWTPLDITDPDIRHLMEAMAFFSARGHLAGRRSVDGLGQRLFAQYFPFLLSPLPAAGLLRAEVTGQLVEPLLLPEGSEIRLAHDSGEAAIFRTLRELLIQPLKLERVDTAPCRGGGSWLRFHLYASSPVEVVQIFVHHLGEHWASARLFDRLTRHAVKSAWGRRLDDRYPGEECLLRAGELGDPERAPIDSRHPVERIRHALHLPQQEHFLNFRLGTPQRGRFTLGVQLDEEWDPDPWLSRRSFHLFVAPIINLNPGPAAPIECDGLKTRHQIHPLEPGARLHSVRGVYRVTAAGMEPLRAGCVFPGEAGTYEVDQGALLRLNLPDAFDAPCRVLVEGDWIAPTFSQYAGAPLQVVPFRRRIAGARWSLVGPLKPHVEPVSTEGAASLVHALALRTKPQLTTGDIVNLLRIIGAGEGYWRETLDCLSQVEVQDEVRSAGGSPERRRHYTLRFTGLAADEAYRARALARHAHGLLDAWLIGGRPDVSFYLEGADFKEQIQ